MPKHKRRFYFSLAFWGLTLGLMLGLFPRSAHGGPFGPDRQKTLTFTVTIVKWWLVDWSDNQTVCEIFVEHDGFPTGSEIFWACGEEVFDDWKDTKPCEALTDNGDPSECKGLYLHRVAESHAERKVSVDLAPATVGLSLEGCVPTFPDNRCESLPTLFFRGEEPLPNERILQIRGTIDGVIFECEGAECRIPLRPTRGSGSQILFWATSSFGDTSPRFEAKVRVVEARTLLPGMKGWFVDILSSQWTGTAPLSCSAIWSALPPLGGPPEWLATPERAEDLATDEPYVFLAGTLISRGLVPEAGECPGSGLLLSGAANACGLDKARPYVIEWQNGFDSVIFRVARDTSLPARLMKSVFAQESQFWPGIFERTDEAGLGMMTPDGADTTFLWNRDFFRDFCALVLDDSVCDRGYLKMTEAQRSMLRGALFTSINAHCVTCPLGFDASQAVFSIQVFAETLLANCGQVGRILTDTTEQRPGDLTGYEDLWRFTLANYNAGPGCLSDAIGAAWLSGDPLDWEHVSAKMAPACQGAIEYVEQTTRE